MNGAQAKAGSANASPRTSAELQLQGIADRLAALNGTLRIASSVGAGTTVTGSIPVRECVAG